MKKYLLLFTSAALLLVACAKEQIVDLQEGELTNVTFTANLDNGVVTKALADGDGAGAKVNRCIMEIYYGDTFYKRLVQPVTNKVATFANVPVVAGKQYTVLFWADCGNGDKTDKYYTTNGPDSLKAVTVNMTEFINALTTGKNDELDAFYLGDKYTITQGGVSKDVTLKRPFAQLNVITTDVAENKAVISEGLLPDAVKVSYTAYNTFNVADSTASGSETYSYEAPVYGNHNTWSDVKNHGELTLSMDYVLAAADKGAIDVEFKVKNGGDYVLTHNLTNLPYQRNYRTNVKGDLLTVGGTWTATIEPTWSTPDYDVPYYVASSIADARNYISSSNTEQAKAVDLTKATITHDDVNADDQTIHFILKTTSPQDLVNFTLPAIPAGIGAQGWTIEYQEGYPTENVGVNAPEGTKVTINAPTSHVTVTGTSYAEIIASTGDNTLVIPQGVTVEKLIVKQGAVEIHGAVCTLTVTPESGKTVCFRACEGLSASVFEKIYNESEHINYIDPMYAYEQVDGKYNIYKLPVVAKIGDVEYPSITAALVAVKANETIEILSDIALDKPITISNSDITIDGNNYTIAVSDAEYWNQYKIGGANQGLGKVNMISVKGSNFTLKDVTLDGKDCRGVSLCTTSGGKDVLYQNVTYTGRGSGHYYGEAAGLVTFDGCKFDTHGYAVHFGGESSVDDDVVIKDCELNGWSSFGACKSVTISDSHFGGANDEGKNGWLAVLRPYCPTTITNCTFSDIFLHEAVTGYDCIGLGTGAATTVILKGCKIVNDSKEETDAAIYSIVRDNGFDNEAAQQGSVFAFDATGNATDGYTAGTFYAKDPAKIKVAPSYEVKSVEGKENIYTVVVKPVAKVGETEYGTLQEALDAARAAMGGTITLVADVVLAKTINWNGADPSKEAKGDGDITDCSNKYTFDLNGYHVTPKEGTSSNIQVKGCEFNIKDSRGGGYISNPNGFGFCFNANREPYLDNCGVLNIYGGEFIGKNSDPCGQFSHTYGLGSSGETNDGYVCAKIINIYDGEFQGLSCDNAQVNIRGGHFTCYIYKGKRDDTNVYKYDKENDAIFIYGGKFDVKGIKLAKEGTFDVIDITSDYLHVYAGDFNFDPSACVMEGSKVEKVGERWIVTQNN